MAAQGLHENPLAITQNADEVESEQLSQLLPTQMSDRLSSVRLSVNRPAVATLRNSSLFTSTERIATEPDSMNTEKAARQESARRKVQAQKPMAIYSDSKKVMTDLSATSAEFVFDGEK